jgi:glycosyltransferase involved in cell wall biosynthesis
MEQPLISIVIPCYNASAWIGDTITSIVSQQDVRYEVILVDDGSDDGSVEVAVAAARGFPLRVITQSRKGVSRARNVGTSEAAGAYIQYIDADDVLLPGTLRARLDALRAGGEVAYCDWVRWEEQPDRSFRETETVRRDMAGRPDLAIFDDAWWPPGALLYSRAVVDAVTPWREDLPVIQDARFLLDAALSGATFVHVPQVGLRYRSHAQSLSKRDPRAFLEDCYRNGRDLHAAWERQRLLDAHRRRYLLRSYAYLARSFFLVDRDRFVELVHRLKELDLHFLPEGPPAFRAMCRVVGYPRGEYVAAAWRRLKSAAAR